MRPRADGIPTKAGQGVRMRAGMSYRQGFLPLLAESLSPGKPTKEKKQRLLVLKSPPTALLHRESRNARARMDMQGRHLRPSPERRE